MDAAGLAAAEGPGPPVAHRDPDRARGLTSGQVAAQIAAGRTNEVPARSSRSIGAILRANVLTWFNGLIFTLFIIMLIAGPFQDSLFGFVIIFNALIGIVQEWRAKRTLDSLAIVGEARLRVRRDGAEAELAAAEIVLDDLVLLGPGEKIPVDGRVEQSTALEVDESLLTGEADPVRKTEGEEVLSGSFVVAGRGEMRATRVGRDAHAAQLAAEAQRFTLVRSELRDGVAGIIKILTYLLIPAGILQIIVQTSIAGGLRNGISRTIAGIVPMVPEGLVLLTSVAFAVGVVRLGQRNCLVQELPAIEGLARVDTVCLDKTGTLTEGGMRLAGIELLDAAGRGRGAEPAEPAESVEPAESAKRAESGPDVAASRVPGDEARVREVLGALGALEERPNATMAAVIEACPAPSPPWSAEAVAAFSSARKWSGATFADGRGTWLFGAPDILGAGNSGRRGGRTGRLRRTQDSAARRLGDQALRRRREHRRAARTAAGRTGELRAAHPRGRGADAGVFRAAEGDSQGHLRGQRRLGRRRRPRPRSAWRRTSARRTRPARCTHRRVRVPRVCVPRVRAL